jgi:hypothetical protein
MLAATLNVLTAFAQTTTQTTAQMTMTPLPDCFTNAEFARM